MGRKKNKLLRNGTCAFCGKQGEVTKDHIPPKGLFPDPKPSNLITVPSCLDCNNKTSDDDQYFITVLSLDMRSDEIATANVNMKTLRGLIRQDSEKFKENLIKDARPMELRTPSGLYAGKTVALSIDPFRLWKTVEKVAKGLVYRITHKVVTEEYVLTTRFYYHWEDLGADFPYYIMDHARSNPQYHYAIGNGAFECSGFEVKGHWFWLMDFYKNHRAMCIMSNSLDPERRVWVEQRKKEWRIH